MSKRKRNETIQNAEACKEDHHHSILGGLKDPTLDSRVSGEETGSIEDGVEHFKIPFDDKSIVCERRGGDGKPALIFTHGAGGGIANPATRDFAAGFATVSPIICFQGTMNLQSRIKTFHATIGHEQVAPALGGRSMGARAAALTALERAEAPNALVLVSYPLTAGKKGERREPERREQILIDLPESIDVLLVYGSEDVQCKYVEMKKVLTRMKARYWLCELKGADHSTSLKDKQGVQALRSQAGSVAAEWLQHRNEGRRYCAIAWDSAQEQITLEEWQELSVS